MLAKLASLHLLLTVVCATIPTLSGYHTVFADDFNAVSGGVADGSKWDQVTIKNAESLKQTQIYTELASNAQTGDGQLYIIPKRGRGSRGEVYYTSARLETYGSWKCDSGKAMIFQAELRVPDMTGSPTKYQGLWPAFWAKGLSSRQGTLKWPDCGEWDIFEQNNGMGSTSQGTLHYRKADGTYSSDRRMVTGYNRGAYNTWAFKVDRRNADWKKQTLSFFVNGHQYYTVTGAMIGTFKQWEILAYQPYYIILNVALGKTTDSYAGQTTEKTVMGLESAMRVKYVAVYKSN